MTQRHRHRTRAWIVGLFLIGCSTSNSENWAITSPTANQLFTMTQAESNANAMKITVNGTCGARKSANNMAVGWAQDNSFVSGPYSITSADDTSKNHPWTQANVILKKPDGAGQPFSTYSLKVAVGRPDPLNPTDFAGFCSVNISLKKLRSAMPGMP